MYKHAFSSDYYSKKNCRSLYNEQNHVFFINEWEPRYI